MKTRDEKQEIITELGRLLKESSGIAVCLYQGLTMKELAELRGKIRPFGAKFMVVKNALARIAAKGTAFEEAVADLTGPNGLVFLKDDASAALKTVFAFSRDHQFFKLQKGNIEKNALNAVGLKAFSELPTKDEVRAMFLGALQASASQMVGVLAGPGRSFVGVLSAFEDKLGGKQAA